MVQFILKSLFPHISVIGDLQYLHIFIKQIFNLGDHLEYLFFRNSRVVKFELQWADVLEIVQGADNIGDVLDRIPGDIYDEFFQSLDRCYWFEKHIRFTFAQVIVAEV